MAKKIDIKKLSKVKNALEVLGKNVNMDYAPLVSGFRKKMKDADAMELETELNITPTAYEEGGNPSRAAMIMKEVEKRRAKVKALRANK